MRFFIGRKHGAIHYMGSILTFTEEGSRCEALHLNCLVKCSLSAEVTTLLPNQFQWLVPFFFQHTFAAIPITSDQIRTPACAVVIAKSMVAPGSIYYLLLKPKLISVIIKDSQQYSTHRTMTFRNMKIIQTIAIQANKWAQFYDN